jgi:hypothetical protein
MLEMIVSAGAPLVEENIRFIEPLKKFFKLVKDN